MSVVSVGKNILRREGVDKITGRAQYVDDVPFQGLFGVTVRSTISRGEILKIEFLEGVNWSEFVVVSAKDIPGENFLALILQDQPVLADRWVNHAEEPILLIAHKNKPEAEKARRLVKISYRELPAIYQIEDSEQKKQIIWGSDNTFKSYLLEKGDIDSIWQNADQIIEAEYETGAQEQLYIEPNGMIAVANKDEGVTVWGSMQCPYYVHKALIKIFPVAEQKIRIIQTETGGGFGGKEEYPSMIAAHAALLAWKSGQAVKIIYDRAEDMTATTKRHPSRTRHKTAVTKDGVILGMDIEFVIDGGAYATLSSVVLSRGTIHAAGPYSIPHVRIKAKALATNHPPHGAFRGFGAPQSLFALERQMNLIAEHLGISPVEVRKKNFLKDGQTTATGQLIQEKVDMHRLLDQGLQKSQYDKKIQEYGEFNKSSSLLKKGIGFATFFHGCGFTGSGERYLASKVGMRTLPDGRAQVLAASTEIGQGTNTVFAQIAADALSVSVEMIDNLRPDTRDVPNSGPTVASRTVMVVGKLVESAAIGLRQTLQQEGFLGNQYTEIDLKTAIQKYHQQNGELKVIVEYEAPPNIFWNDDKYQGDAYGSYAWAVYVADVEVDLRTFETKVMNFYALQDVGRVINPILAEGQIEGGVAQGIGYAIYEKCRYEKGHLKNGQMTNYIMPTSADLPNIKVQFLESPYAYGPSGAKGIGELPLDGPAPAVINAIENATKIRVQKIPCLPEDLFMSFGKAKKDREASI
jgi:CO/xanthine dehydrogenase Mo-binding subunit